MYNDVIVRGRKGGSIIIAGSKLNPVFFSRGNTGLYRFAVYSGCYVSVLYGDFFAMSSTNDEYSLVTDTPSDIGTGGSQSAGGLKVYEGAILDPVNNFSFSRLPNTLTLNMDIPTVANDPTYGGPEYIDPNTGATGYGSVTIDNFFFGGGTGNTVVRNNSNGAIILTNAIGNSAAAGVGEIYDKGIYNDPGDPDRIIWQTNIKCIWKGNVSTSWNDKNNWIDDAGNTLTFVPGIDRTDVDVIIAYGADSDCHMDINNVVIDGTLRVNFDVNLAAITGTTNTALYVDAVVTLCKVGLDFMIDANGDIIIHSTAAPNNARIEIGGTINFENNGADIDPGTSTLACVGNQRQRVTLRGEELYNLEVAISKSADVFAGGITCRGNLEIKGGLYRGNAGGGNVIIKGDVIQTGGDIYPWNSDFFIEGNWLNSGGTMANPGNGTFNFEPGNTTTKQIQTNGQKFTTVNFNDNSLGALTEYDLLDDWTILTKLTIKNDCQLNIPDGITAKFGETNVNSGGILNIKGGGTLEMEAGEILTIKDGGKIKIIGENEKYARLTRQGSLGQYSFDVSGTISARYYLIESMDVNGVNLKSNSRTESPGTINYGGGGNGYTSTPTVTVSGGGGSGADFEAQLTGDVVTSYTKPNTLSTATVANAGDGYPTDGNFPVTITGGTTNGTVIITVNAGKIISASIFKLW